MPLSKSRYLRTKLANPCLMGYPAFRMRIVSIMPLYRNCLQHNSRSKSCKMERKWEKLNQSGKRHRPLASSVRSAWCIGWKTADTDRAASSERPTIFGIANRQSFCASDHRSPTNKLAWIRKLKQAESGRSTESELGQPNSISWCSAIMKTFLKDQPPPEKGF